MEESSSPIDSALFAAGDSDHSFHTPPPSPTHSDEQRLPSLPAPPSADAEDLPSVGLVEAMNVFHPTIPEGEVGGSADFPSTDRQPHYPGPRSDDSGHGSGAVSSYTSGSDTEVEHSFVRDLVGLSVFFGAETGQVPFHPTPRAPHPSSHPRHAQE
jgi:hypothetical protein